MTASTIKNRTIFCRDNLDVMRGMESATIDLIYLDPPFNKKKTFSAAPTDASLEGASFADIFRETDTDQDWLKNLQTTHPPIRALLQTVKTIERKPFYNFHYLAYMAIRLLECHRILKPTGSLYLHCDPTMSHYLKLLLDCIFGEKNFRNELIWAYRTGGATKTRFARKHDIIFCYAKDDSQCYFATQTERVYYDKPFFSNQTDANGRYYADVIMTDWWDDIKPLINLSAERIGYPTQKPRALLERIITASSREGDMVLDPFCGCATTCIAAEKLGRQWIGIDISPTAQALGKERFAKECDATDAPLFFEPQPPNEIKAAQPLK